MTALRQEALALMEQLPEEQMPDIIRYIHTLKSNEVYNGTKTDSGITPKMRAFNELVNMLIPVQDLDYEKELAKARDEKYGYTG